MGEPVSFAVPATFAILRNAVPVDLIERTRAFVMWAVGYREPPPDGQAEADWSSNLRSLCQKGLLGHPERLLEGFWQSDILAVCREALGPDIAYVVDTTLIRDFNPVYRPRPARMHFDAHIFGPQTPMLTVWVPLNDVGRESPGLSMANRPHWPSHLWERLADAIDADGAYRPGKDFTRSYSHEEIYELARAEAEWPFFEPELDAGDVCIFDQQYIHGTQTSLPRPGKRMSLEIRVLPVKEVQRLIQQGSKSLFVKLG